MCCVEMWTYLITVFLRWFGERAHSLSLTPQAENNEARVIISGLSPQNSCHYAEPPQARSEREENCCWISHVSVQRDLMRSKSGVIMKQIERQKRSEGSWTFFLRLQILFELMRAHLLIMNGFSFLVIKAHMCKLSLCHFHFQSHAFTL